MVAVQQLIQVSSRSPPSWSNSDPLATVSLKIQRGSFTVADFSKIEG
jgi:hypothetical protein